MYHAHLKLTAAVNIRYAEVCGGRFAASQGVR